MRHAITLSAALLVAACTAGDGNEYAAANETSAGTGNESTEVVPEGETPPAEGNAGAEVVPIPPDSTVPPAGPPADDPKQCGADEYQWLVGESRSRIPEQPEGANWRIACTTCPVTMDYSPARMNIFYDEEKGIVEEVKCG